MASDCQMNSHNFKAVSLDTLLGLNWGTLGPLSLVLSSKTVHSGSQSVALQILLSRVWSRSIVVNCFPENSKEGNMQVRKISIQGEGYYTACAVVNQL